MRSRLWETGGRRAPNTRIKPAPIPHYMTPQTSGAQAIGGSRWHGSARTTRRNKQAGIGGG